ncbi:hypothetical protein [Cesiribacter andamanensis]|uniref:Uncharacterized protein n=1 Tax=Cesiribacter andamanensis AMV16 TaxID=1279009 RepID=M7NC38_9BACT|nr:hypothetical protein [Cesiribacter andamanensis]EMR04787.1 hypothetical protein ADICEAN_00058 [Cesiribacter andamanensis AMV16]
MKKILHLSLLLLIAQGAQAGKAPGFFVRPEGDTVWVEFQVHATRKKASFVKNQEALIYFDQLGKKHFLMPAQATVACVAFGRDTIEMHAFPNTVGIQPLSLDDDGYQFFSLEEKGKVKLFSFVDPSKAYAGGGAVGGVAVALVHTPTSYFLQYENQSLHRVKPLSFRVDMADFFREHTELADRIYRGDYSIGQLSKIVQEFNAYRAQDSYEAHDQSLEGF